MHLAVLTRGLIELMQTHGAAALENALVAALGEDTAHLGAVRHFMGVFTETCNLVRFPVDKFLGERRSG